MYGPAETGSDRMPISTGGNRDICIDGMDDMGGSCGIFCICGVGSIGMGGFICIGWIGGSCAATCCGGSCWTGGREFCTGICMDWYCGIEGMV